MRVIYGLGRAVLGGFFLYNGVNHLSNTEALEGYAAAKQVQNPHLAVQGSGALMALAGASLILGIKPKLGALGACGFLAVASAQMHDFWNIPDEQAKQADLIQFSKNVALMGALLAIAGDTKK
ncbi:MAG: DoxX family protein [Janthinobacterium lividum]